jgi:CPA1 family monovalent cation:H+ antiporter
MSTEWLASLVIAVVALVTLLSRRFKIAEPILLMVAGVGLALLPGLPAIQVDPDLLLLVVLPPMLFWHAFIVTPREIKANAAAISLTSVVLVAITAFAVAAVLHCIAGLPWAIAMVFGAIVAPTDPVAFLTVARQLNVSPRLVGLLDGENLINDFTALVLYLTAIDAVLHGSFSTFSAVGNFMFTAAGGVMIGYAVGRLVSWINTRVADPLVAPIITLAGAYLAFLPAEALHVSAILAAGVAGRVVGSRSALVDRPQTRLGGYGFWNTWIFLLSAVLFVLVGLQLPQVLEKISTLPGIAYACAGAIAAVMVTRVLFFMGIGLGIPHIARRMRMDGARWPWADNLVAGWSGMRGGLSLVMVLALPEDFPFRDIALIVTFSVILVTLVVQGISMPWLIKNLPVERDTFTEQEIAQAHRTATGAALSKLEEIGALQPIDADHSAYLQQAYRIRSEQFAVTETVSRIEGQLIDAERKAIIELRHQGTISDEVLREVEQALDMRDVLRQV